jgi:hypothetical protein
MLPGNGAFPQAGIFGIQKIISDYYQSLWSAAVPWKEPPFAGADDFSSLQQMNIVNQEIRNNFCLTRLF